MGVYPPHHPHQPMTVGVGGFCGVGGFEGGVHHQPHPHHQPHQPVFPPGFHSVTIKVIGPAWFSLSPFALMRYAVSVCVPGVSFPRLYVYFPLVSLLVNNECVLSRNNSISCSFNVSPEAGTSSSFVKVCPFLGTSSVINALYIVMVGVWYFLGGGGVLSSHDENRRGVF